MPEPWIEVQSGVSLFTGEGFCTVVVRDREGKQSRGQMSPAEVRDMALGWLAAADAAESDAALMAELASLELDEQIRVGFLAALRARRAGE
ncbi:MAG TPA: hypothetical protein VGH54_21265 [Mycobacterium sp.]|jgi:hypothetical protein|uniref:hypothetical protein n=1 Tax=Mycobacterium sp. TaxID=1785 RepID=UPI002F3EECF8